MELNLELMTWLIPVFPLLAFGIIVLFTNRWNGLSHWVAIGAYVHQLCAWHDRDRQRLERGRRTSWGSIPLPSSEDWLPMGRPFLEWACS